MYTRSVYCLQLLNTWLFLFLIFFPIFESEFSFHPCLLFFSTGHLLTFAPFLALKESGHFELIPIFEYFLLALLLPSISLLYSFKATDHWFCKGCLVI